MFAIPPSMAATSFRTSQRTPSPTICNKSSRSNFEAVFAPEIRAQWIGNWGFLGLFLRSAVFNTFLGEEFIFRGVLMPKMEGVFGKWDWVANGILFCLYHLHQPWGILATMPGDLMFAYSGRRNSQRRMHQVLSPTRICASARHSSSATCRTRSEFDAGGNESVETVSARLSPLPKTSTHNGRLSEKG